MSGSRAGRHRSSWFSDHASEAKVVLWVGVATVLTGLIGAAATLVGEYPPWAGTRPAPADMAAGGPGATPSPGPTLTPSPTPVPEPSPTTGPVTAASSAPAALPPLTEIPADFLLHDGDVAREPEVWKSHDEPVGYDLIQCHPFDLRDVPYTDIRVLQGLLPGRSYFETLILYGGEVTAARVFGTLRQAIQDCPLRPWSEQPGGTVRRTQQQYDGEELPSGAYDESMLVSEAYYDSAGQAVAKGRRMMITRRGTAVVLYSIVGTTLTAPHPDDFAPLVDDTAEILPAMCKFDEPRCP